jgi:hypothetical protein
MANLKLESPVDAASAPAMAGQPGVLEVAGPTIAEPPLNALGISMALLLLAVVAAGMVWLMIRFRGGSEG